MPYVFLASPGAKHVWPDQRRLLIAQDSRDRNALAPHRAWLRRRPRCSSGSPAASAAECRTRRATPRSQSSVSQIHQLRAAGVGAVGDDAGRVRCQTRNVSMLPNSTSPASACCASAGNMVENPADFQRAEICGQRQAGLGAEAVGPAVARKFGDTYRPRAYPARRARCATGLPVCRSHSTVVSR